MGILIVVTFLDLIPPKIAEEWSESNRVPLKNPLVSTISWSILGSRE